MMKKIVKAFILAAAAGIFSVAANAQTDDSKIETVKLEKLGEMKTVEYSIKPGESRDIAIVDSKISQHLFIKSSQQGVPSENASKTPTTPAVINSSTISMERTSLVKVQAKTNWTLKKDGKETATGNDAHEYTSSTANSNKYNMKFYADTTQVLSPGMYVISIKCVQDKPCGDKLTVGYTLLGSAPDPTNLEP